MNLPEGSGYQTSLCRACNRLFTSPSAFDAHRTGSFSESGERIVDKGKTEPRGPRRCLDPMEVGLELTDRKYTCWGFPKGDEWWKDD